MSPSEIRPTRCCGGPKSACGSRCENAHVGIWDMDYTSGLLQWSDVLEAQYGLAPGTFDGTFERSASAFTRTIGHLCSTSSASAMKTGTDFTVLHRMIRPDGTVRWLSGAGRILLDDSGQPLRAVGISQDVTERHVAGGAVSAGAEDGSHRAPGRRRRARLQQPADRDSRLLRAAAGRRRSRRSAQIRHHGNSESGHARRGAHDAAAGLQPQADHRADAARPEHHPRRHAADARTPHQGRRQDPAGPAAAPGDVSRPIAVRWSRSC